MSSSSLVFKQTWRILVKSEKCHPPGRETCRTQQDVSASDASTWTQTSELPNFMEVPYYTSLKWDRHHTVVVKKL